LAFVRFLTVFLFAAFVGAPAAAQPTGFGGGERMVEARLLADRSAVAPGERVSIALHQDITPGWHTYWRNPGDSGEPTRLFLTLPDGWTAGEIEWPAPTAYPLGPLTNYGYSDQVTLPMTLSVPADAPSGPVTIEARATWLVCEEICIPEEADLTLSLEVGESVADEAGAAQIADARRLVPQPAAGLESGLILEDSALVLTASGPTFAGGAEAIREVAFFPHEAGIIDHAAEQPVALADGALRIDLEAGFDIDDAVTNVHPGVITFERFENGGWRDRAVEIAPQPGAAVNALSAGTTTAPTGPASEAGAPPAPASIGFLQAALLALAGGLLLNLMPCVFPILSMKALTLVNKRGSERGEAALQGLLYGAGVILTFLALGGALLALRVLGLPDLWGFQLQSPIVVLMLAGLMFLIGLNFIGAFEIGTSLQGVGGSVKGGTRTGSFLTGVLAVFVAAPCLAPFMTGALAFAFTQPPAASLAIFGFLGVGLAAPFVLVASQPSLLNALPKPGPWMERFKQFLAFPMFATAIWLVWVLSVQTGSQGVLFALLTLLGLGFTVWALRQAGVLAKGAAALGAVAAAAAVLAVSRVEMVEASGAGAGWEDWSVARVEQLQAEGRPVFVDFTAAWCVTCQVNKLGALSDSRVLAAFAEHDVALLRADFTNRDPEIAAELGRWGSAGVPLYLMFPADGGEPDILPPLLTETIVIRSVEDAV